MKKWLLILSIFFLLLVGSLYVLIPNVVGLKTNVEMNVTQQGLYRMLLDSNSVKKWWPGQTANNTVPGVFKLNGYNYKIYNNSFTLLPITITDSTTSLKTSLYIISLQTDTVKLAWVGAMATSYNPVKRFLLWQKAKKINRDMDIILQHMNSFYGNDENIYGIKVNKELVKDSVLIGTGAESKGYPDTKFIYGLIDQLRNYAVANGASETGFPMLNVDTEDSLHYNVRVALPVSKLLPNKGTISQKRMPANGNILVTEVKGGVAIGSRAFTQITQYARDYKRVPPAITFYSLVTDRSKEPDSSKWITRIYCPVM
jgi:hypothetical protein